MLYRYPYNRALLTQSITSVGHYPHCITSTSSLALGILAKICYNFVNIQFLTQPAAIAQLVERIHGKDEVSGSTPDRGSKKL